MLRGRPPLHHLPLCSEPEAPDNTTDDKILTLIECNNEEVKQENSNKNPTVNSVQRDYMAGEISKDLTQRAAAAPGDREGAQRGPDPLPRFRLLCPAHAQLRPGQPGGYAAERHGHLRHADEKPHSFSTACNIATQIIAQVASNQYGGQSISLTHLAPFVDVSRKKIAARSRPRSRSWHRGRRGEDPEIVERRLRDEITRGVQTIQYQVVTLMTTNGQAPFITVFMYLNEARDNQEKHDLAMIMEETLRQRYQGVKNEAGVWITPAFPKLIYVLEDDNVYEDSPYFYLTQLAAKCTAKRMVPDYISEKKMRELKLKVRQRRRGRLLHLHGLPQLPDARPLGQRL